MSRFYRHVLIEKHYPHHCAVEEIDYNFPKGNYYPTENPFA